MLRFRFGVADRERLGGPEWYDYDNGKLMLSEARQLQKFTGMTVREFEEQAKRGDIEAIAFLVWLTRSRLGIKERYSDLEFDIAEFEMDTSDDPKAIEGEVVEGNSAAPSRGRTSKRK